MEIDDYLRISPYTSLVEFGIKITKHLSENLAIVNYSQIDSPRSSKIAQQCRGTVIDTITNRVVARGFPRFFNWGEMLETDSAKNFNFGNFISQSKEDGSLVIVFSHNGKWFLNTRMSFGNRPIMFEGGITWREAFCQALNITSDDQLDKIFHPEYSYIFEFCSPYNKIVRQYSKPAMFLLSMFEGERELPWVDTKNTTGPWSLPKTFDFKSTDEITKFLNEQSKTDPTFEGVVIRDNLNNRWKIKSPTYLSLHQMHCNGNILLPKYLLPFIVNGETEELLVYFPECKEAVKKFSEVFNEAKNSLLNLWGKFKNTPNQKDFALAIKNHPLNSILFEARKNKTDPVFNTDLVLNRLTFVL